MFFIIKVQKRKNERKDDAIKYLIESFQSKNMENYIMSGFKLPEQTNFVLLNWNALKYIVHLIQNLEIGQH